MELFPRPHRVFPFLSRPSSSLFVQFLSSYMIVKPLLAIIGRRIFRKGK